MSIFDFWDGPTVCGKGHNIQSMADVVSTKTQLMCLACLKNRRARALEKRRALKKGDAVPR